MQPLNQTEIAWAAGFFDGEGSTSYYRLRIKGRNRDGRVIRVQICQAHFNREVLDRFHQAVGGIGKVVGPYRAGSSGYHWQYRADIFSQAQAVVAILWKYLSAEKRRQAKEALLLYRNHRYEKVA